ncbi:MAG: extracellular solute-binding protein [Candidatus Sumerlaeia bacterium]|nr:extracellular solute-binding protein [Candidatus Sumerlaeia bacterium]
MRRLITAGTLTFTAAGGWAQLDLAQVAADLAARAVPVRLTFWQTHNAEETVTLQALVASFEAQFPGVDIDMAYEPFDGAHDKFLVAAQAGEGPDVMRAEIMWVSEFASLGLLREVTYDLTDEDRADFLPNTLATADYDGDLWGLPQVTDCLALLYNRRMFERAGLTPPATWQELVAQRDEWQAAHPGIHEFAFAISDSYFFLPFLWSFGGDMLDPDTHEPLIHSAEAAAALQFILDQQDAGVLPPDFDIANDYNNRMEALKNGRVGSILNGPWATADLLAGPEFSDPANLGIAPVPHSEGGDVRVAPVGGHTLVISAGCDEPEAAYLFIHWLTQPGQQAVFAERNNLLPTRESAYSLPAVQGNRLVAEFGEVLAATARNRPVLPNAGNLFPPLDRGFQEAMRRARPPAEALRQVATDWRGVLAP